MQSLLRLSQLGRALAGGGAPSYSTLFSSASVLQPKRWRAFLLSVALHVLVLLFTPSLTYPLIGESDRDAWRRQQRLLRTLRIRIPEQLYLASSGHTPQLPRKPAPLRAPRRASLRDANEGTSPSTPGRKQQVRRRRFELPSAVPRSESPQTVLQPQFAHTPRPPRDIQLPEVFFWAPQTELPRFAKPFLMPGHSATPTRPRVLDAPPRLEAPVAEPVSMQVPAIPESSNALRLLAAPALPIRTAETDSAPRTGVSAEPAAGDPTTVLSLALNPEALREFLSVPPGNQVGRLPATGGKDPSAFSASRSGGGTGGTGGVGAGSGSADAEIVSGREVGEPLPAAADRQSPATGVPAADREPAVARDGVPSATGLRAAAITAAAVTTIVHPPDGVFDIVVQSSGVEGLPESAGVLSGKPVYSVYVRTGDSRDWILQYCIPAGEDQATQVSGPVVRLGTPSPLSAPYPRVTMRPPVRRRKGGYLVVHGMVTAEGRFQDLRVLGAVESWEADAVIAVLGGWEFRPASRDRVSIRVETLLAIPTGE